MLTIKWWAGSWWLLILLLVLIFLASLSYSAEAVEMRIGYKMTFDDFASVDGPWTYEVYTDPVRKLSWTTDVEPYEGQSHVWDQDSENWDLFREVLNRDHLDYWIYWNIDGSDGRNGTEPRNRVYTVYNWLRRSEAGLPIGVEYPPSVIDYTKVEMEIWAYQGDPWRIVYAQWNLYADVPSYLLPEPSALLLLMPGLFLPARRRHGADVPAVS